MANNMLANVIKQAFNPKRLPILCRKIVSRLFEGAKEGDKNAALEWLSSRQEDFADYAMELDEKLWHEALEYAKKLEAHSSAVLDPLNVKLGGGGFYPLIYFVTRYMKPQVVVETGVAAGFSSHAFLSAMAENKKQTGSSANLYSSDFPYFRLENPEQYIGILVPAELKENWSLHIDGDEKNLPAILSSVEEVDLFHYDSDKRYSGREFAMKAICPKLSSRGVVIMDDINDNAFFMELCQKEAGKAVRIFEFGGKYIGMLGDLSSR